MKIGHVLGWINTRIILGMVSFIMFAPVALVLRLLGKDPMQRRLDTTARLPNSKRATASRTHGETVLMLDLLKDLWDFLKVRKKFWLAPIILVLVLLGGLIVLSQGSAVAPFIYTLF